MSTANCPFCEIDRAIVLKTDHFLVIKDHYPVTEGHSLIIPRRHVPSLRDLDADELADLLPLTVRTENQLMSADRSIDGFNLGINEGASAGQTVFHLHLHVIPRRTGDVRNPRGGVRGVIPSKQKY